MDRRHVSTGTEWESAVGYSRAVRVGPHVHVAGTTATDAAGELVGRGDSGEQTRQALENVARALDEAGASIEDIVRTRLYVTDVEDWEAIGEAHAAVFGAVRPATSMVEVARLIDPAMCVEIEATAVVADAAADGAGDANTVDDGTPDGSTPDGSTVDGSTTAVDAGTE
jgi:enamine deaminase RidA (YjgF/YER057c/UK114 family)